MTDSPSRRDVLRASGLALVAGVAGCTSDDSANTTKTTTTREPTQTTTSTTTETTDEPLALPEHAVWGFDLDGDAQLAPALVDGTLYVGREDGQLFALDPASGDTEWDADAGVGFFSGVGGLGETPSVVDGRVFLVSGAQSGVAGEGFQAVGLAADTGEELWTATVEDATFLTLLGVQDDRVLVGSSDDYIQNEGETLASLDPESGDAQWTGEIGDPMEWTLGAGGAYVSAYSGMRAVSLADGTTRWSKSGGVVDGLHVQADTLVAGFEPEGRPSLAGYDPASGDRAWRGPDWTVRSYEASDGVVYAGGENLAAFDAATGSEQWTQSGDAIVTEPPVGGRLFAYAGEELTARDPETGTRQWGRTLSPSASTTFGESVIASIRGQHDDSEPPGLVVLDAADGSERFATTIEDATRLHDPVVDGTSVYVATTDGRVFAFEA